MQQQEQEPSKVAVEIKRTSNNKTLSESLLRVGGLFNIRGKGLGFYGFGILRPKQTNQKTSNR